MEEGLLERFQSGDERALARVLSLIEAAHPIGESILAQVRTRHQANVVGITGAPGSGKSTLVDQLIGTARTKGERVAVLAVDPSSPFSGGAILGDRVRMGRHFSDRSVYVRSMASRGALGGLGQATVAGLGALEGFGFDRVIVETVGVGQSEVDIASVADTVVLVLTPNTGDAVQAFKAGVMEIADIFVINKADLPGSDRLERELRATLELGHHLDRGGDGSWSPAIVKTVASTGEGSAELFATINAHRQHLGPIGLNKRRLERARFEIAQALQYRARLALERQGALLIEQVAEGRTSATQAVDQLVLAGL